MCSVVADEFVEHRMHGLVELPGVGHHQAVKPPPYLIKQLHILPPLLIVTPSSPAAL